MNAPHMPTPEDLNKGREAAHELRKQTKERIKEMLESVASVHGEEVAMIAQASIAMFSTMTTTMFILGGVMPPDAYAELRNSVEASFGHLESAALSLAVNLRDGDKERTDEDLEKEAAGLMRLMDAMKTEEVNFVNSVQQLGNRAFGIGGNDQKGMH